jgi:hypothetical protein
MTVDVRKLPFSYAHNLSLLPVTGKVEVRLTASVAGAAVLESAASAVGTWTEIVNHQWLSVRNVDAYAAVRDQQKDGPTKSVALTLEVREIDAAAWLVLIGLLAQTHHAEPELSSVQIIDTNSAEPLINTLDPQWAAQAEQSLYAADSPHPLIALVDGYALDEPIDVDIECGHPLHKSQVEQIAEGLEYWGYLVGMGACRFDFLEPKEFYADFGTTAPLTANALRYTKDNFDGPEETLHLLKHWLAGLERQGIAIQSVEVSQ